METLALSDEMLQEFQDGCLAPLRDYVCADDTLTMRFLGRQVEIDYRGQVIIKIWQIGNKYSIYTMPFFNRYLDPAEGDNMDKILSLIPHYKNATDDLLWEDPDTQRELRQRMARINNSTGMSRQTDYYIVANDYRGGRSKSSKSPSIDMVAVKGFVGDDDTTVPELSVALIQMSTGSTVPSIEEQAYWTTDLDTAMQGYLNGAEVYNKASAARELASNEEWVRELKNNVARMFRQKCELGLIDRYLEPDAEISISDEPPEINVVAVNTNPRRIGVSSQLFRLAGEDATDSLAIFRGAPMGIALFEDYRIPLKRYLAERPVPKRRVRLPLGIDEEDASRLQASVWLLERVKERIEAEEETELDWAVLAKCLSRMDAFLVQLLRREQAILDSLPEKNDALATAIAHIAAAEDALSTIEQIDSVELETGILSDEMKEAACEFILATEAALRAALAAYELPDRAPEG